jgi:hypothetical protein
MWIGLHWFERSAIMAAQRAPDVSGIAVTTPDGVPIEDLPGWDAKRDVFVLDRSRTADAKRRVRSGDGHTPEHGNRSPAQRRK